MTTLEKLYQTLQNLKDLDLDIDAKLLSQINDREEEIIRDEILPALSQDIAPRLNPIKRDLVLVVEYHPGEPISVALSRKAKISDFVDAKPLTPSYGTPVYGGKAEPVEAHEPTREIENPTRGIRVTFPDGTVVQAANAIDTEVALIRKVGYERVAQLGIMHAGFNLVSRSRRPTVKGRTWQVYADGWYIYSNTNNLQKVHDLRTISQRLGLGLKIEDAQQGL